MRNTVINNVYQHARLDPNVFVISGDAGFGVLDQYQAEFPDRYLNMGVAEQNMIGFSAGMSMAGFNIVAYNIVPFVLYRCYEQVRNDICYQRLPVTLVGVGSGLTYAPGGMTHYSVEDIGVARTLPNLTVLSPADPVEAESAINFALRHDGPVYIRVAKTGEPCIHAKPPDDIGRPILIQEGRKVAVLFHGSVSEEVMELVGDTLLQPAIFSVPMLQPLDFESLDQRLAGIEVIITVEEHFAEIGLGGIVAGWVAREHRPYRVITLGIKSEYIHAVKNVHGMRRHYGIAAGDVREAVQRAFVDG